ncbi:apolipoprotein N-acyltransferase [Desulfospira joergensenii]|uniref:apolipoprotein N-acyltransferase n=1 Tax=Desulfospira joergensenii TaxID=53329 RepID=UPI0003B5232A|nr:apolipoprotein N-acyltransferase [Desulfospira joergensenii]
MIKKVCLLPAIKYFPSLLSGLMLTACFPNPGLGFLAFAALVPFLVAVDSLEAGQAFYAGLVTGLVHYITLIYWIIPTLSTYGGLHPLLSSSALILLSLYLSLFPALFAFIMKKLDPHPLFQPLLGAFVWVGLEFTRTHVFTGFPWGVLGYTQYANLTLVQTADLTGVLGLSFLILLSNYLLASLWLFFKTPSGRSRPGSKIRAWACLFYILPLFAGAFFYGKTRILDMDRAIESAPQIGIALVQGNIRQDLKWSPAFKQETIDKYASLSLTASTSKPDLIIWPETALPFYYGYDTALSNRIDQVVRKARTPFLIGSPAFERDGQSLSYFNRAYMLDSLSLVRGHYDKVHLVPFGEYVPFGKYLAFMEKLTQEAGDFSPGTTGFAPLQFTTRQGDEHSTGVLICFEILFPSLSREFVRNGADFLTTMTNDAWFGRTSAPAQHFSIAVLRAVENRRSVARAANSGISGFIGPGGRILDRTGLFQDRVLVRQIPVLREISFYTRHPFVLVLAALVAISAAFMVKVVKKPLRRT